MESGNPSQGRLRERTNEAVVLTGKDKAYMKAAEMGLLFIPYDENGQPIELRAARHVTGVRVACELLGDVSPEDAWSLREFFIRRYCCRRRGQMAQGGRVVYFYSWYPRPQTNWDELISQKNIFKEVFS